MSAHTTYCATCEDEALISDRGLCVWCDTPLTKEPAAAPEPDGLRLVPRPPRPSNIGPPRGARNMTFAVLQEAYELYLHGQDADGRPLSLRVVAARLLDRTDYSSVKSFTNCLSDAFREQGWPVRDRVAATVAAHYKHGLAPKHGSKRDYKRMLRDQTGRQPRCAGVRLQYPKKGQPCQLPAHKGSSYCRFHDPELRDQVVDVVERARAELA